MIFNSYLNEGASDVQVPGIDPVDPNTEEGLKKIADEVEANTQATALESLVYFDGGEQALREFCESEEAQVLVESRKLGKKTFVRIGKNDDLTRRKNMASLILSRENKDPLFNKLALNRVKERELRNKIYAKYGQKALKIAKLSQISHIKAMKKMPSLPQIKLQ